jgi:2-phosphosulfolactate phosphatase
MSGTEFRYIYLLFVLSLNNPSSYGINPDMKITTFATPSSIASPDETIRGRYAVVIDTLRATSVIATALHAGAACVIPVAEVEEALKAYGGMPVGTALLCGERGGKPIPGFHFGNSPFEFTPETVRGRTLVMTTTNGTRAILAAAGAARLALGAMLNASAVATQAVALGMDVTIICAGTNGLFSLEDTLTAGAIIDAMGMPDATLDDLSRVALGLYKQNRNNLLGALKDCAHAKRLIDIGYGRDLEYCTKLDLLDIVPCYTNGSIEPHHR